MQGNDAVTKFRSLPYVGLLATSVRDAIWAEDTIFGGIDWRLFAPQDSVAYTALRKEAWRRYAGRVAREAMAGEGSAE